MLSIIDYGVGNLFSLCSSLKSLGEEAVVTSDPAIIKSSDRLILPGVGAFGDAAEKLRYTGLDKVIKQAAADGKPLLGICLGMQLLFDKSYEFGEYEGLGLIKGNIVPLKGVIPESCKIPHIGWNALELKGESPLFKYIKNGDFVYFVHSFYLDGADEDVVAGVTQYGVPIECAIQKGRLCAVQFHPEKSSKSGLALLKNFLNMEVE